MGNVTECSYFYSVPDKEHKRMTPKEAENVLMHIGDYVVFDEEYGCLIKSSLMDATLLAIRALREKPTVYAEAFRALREKPTVYAETFPAPEAVDIHTTEVCGRCGCQVTHLDHFCPGCGATFKREK
jgi:hypothetical protein